MMDFIKDNPIQGAKVVAQYLSNNRDILRRLGLYLIGQNPDIFRSEIIRELLNSENMDDVDIHHEFFMLLRNRFSLLSDSDKETLIKRF